MLSWLFQSPEEYLNEALESSKDQNCVENDQITQESAYILIRMVGVSTVSVENS